MAAGWSVMDALNKNSKAAAEEKPKARFRTRDISIRKIYSNDRNFYSMPGIEQLAQEILAVGLMENMTVAYAPCERGEYKIIAGERRWRALNLLLEKGYEDFETVTCQIKSAAEENEEMVQLIIANAYRDKTIVDMLEEEKRLKESLQYMKDNGLTLQGYKLDSGRLRDVIASIMNTTGTKITRMMEWRSEKSKMAGYCRFQHCYQTKDWNSDRKAFRWHMCSTISCTLKTSKRCEDGQLEQQTTADTLISYLHSTEWV